MARLEKTIQAYQQQLKQKGIKNIPEFVQSILYVDITKGKYLKFLLDCFLNEKFRKEDLQGGLNSIIGQAITLFHKHKNKLPEEMRSVYKYDSPGDLWNAVKQFDGVLSGKEIKREEQDKVYAETEFVYEDKNTGFKIVSPLTEDAAKWWGKGTRWCTSAEKNNMFYRYAKDAPLLIFLMPSGDKLQLWKNQESVQFMDEADNKVSLEYIEQHWNILEPVCQWLMDLRFIPERYRDYDLCFKVVKQDGYALRNVPEEHKDYNLCLEAVKQNGYVLDYIPERFKDKNFYLLAIKNNTLIYSIYNNIYNSFNFETLLCINGLILEFVPPNKITKKLCQIAVNQNGMALKYVPQSYFKSLFNFNKKFTVDLCKLALSKNLESKKYIPLNFYEKNFSNEFLFQDFHLKDVKDLDGVRDLENLEDLNCCNKKM